MLNNLLLETDKQKNIEHLVNRLNEAYNIIDRLDNRIMQLENRVKEIEWNLETSFPIDLE